VVSYSERRGTSKPDLFWALPRFQPLTDSLDIKFKHCRLQVAEGMGVTGAPPCVSRSRGVQRLDALTLFSWPHTKGSREGLRGEEVAKIICSRLYTCIHEDVGNIQVQGIYYSWVQDKNGDRVNAPHCSRTEVFPPWRPYFGDDCVTTW
jgi:hypothetical protein